MTDEVEPTAEAMAAAVGLLGKRVRLRFVWHELHRWDDGREPEFTDNPQERVGVLTMAEVDTFMRDTICTDHAWFSLGIDGKWVHYMDAGTTIEELRDEDLPDPTPS